MKRNGEHAYKISSTTFPLSPVAGHAFKLNIRSLELAELLIWNIDKARADCMLTASLITLPDVASILTHKAKL